MLVEDEGITRRGGVRERGFTVYEAGTSDAIDVLHTDPLVDLVVTDVGMPGEMDGFALARR